MATLLVFTLALLLVALVGWVSDSTHPARRRVPVLLHNGNTNTRARVMSTYYIHVQDSVS